MTVQHRRASLPLFLSQRAMIRAHVKAATDQQQEGLRLLQAAQAYLQPQKPIVLAIGALVTLIPSCLVMSRWLRVRLRCVLIPLWTLMDGAVTSNGSSQCFANPHRHAADR